MNHHTTTDFWDCYRLLPESIRQTADANYQLLRQDPRHPSLHFKRIGRFWSVRVGLGYRALAVDDPDGPIWFWIGPHAVYNKMLKSS